MLPVSSELWESCKNEDDFELNRPHRPLTPTTVTLQLPSPKLTAVLSQVDGKCQLISTRNLLALQSKIIGTGGTIVNRFSMSTSTVWCQRTKARTELTEKLKVDFEKPEFVVAHWDSKVKQYLSRKTYDHVAILASGFSLDSPELRGIPKIPRQQEWLKRMQWYIL